jgi:hypothetical protein
MAPAGTADRYNSRPRTAGTPVTDVPCRREQIEADEDRSDRDEQRQQFTYWFMPDAVVSGRGQIIDGGDTLEVIGEPKRVDGRAGTHHIELRAQLVKG